MSKPKSAMVYLVGAGPGDPGLLTLRAAELLRRAEVVVHDALIPAAILRLIPAGREVIEAGKRGGEAGTEQAAIEALLVDRARAGKTVVRLKGGDPYVFGRGAEEVEALVAAGISFEVVPGISSFAGAAAYAGIPLTYRACASAFTVASGHLDPADSANPIDWGRLAAVHGTKVILMGMQQLPGIVRSLMEAGMSASTPAALIRWGTTPEQQTVEGTLETIVTRAEASGLTAPVVVVIGEVVRLRARLNWFERRPLFGQRVVVTRAREQAGDLVGRLAELGADVLEVPAIRIEPPTERQPLVECLAGLGEYDWVVFTSANGVTSFFDALLAAFQDIRSLGNLRVAAVGPATAARLRELHLRVDAMPGQFLGKEVARAIAEQESLDNLRVLLARAETASPEVVRELENQGAIVDDVAFYRTVAEAGGSAADAARLESEGADWITFTSGSTVAHLHARFDLHRLMSRHPRLRLASIGPETSKAIRDLGLTPHAEAKTHTTEGLVATLVEASRRRASSD